MLLSIVFVGMVAAAQDPAVLFSQGLQAYASEDYERAMSLFEQAVKMQPNVAAYHHWFGRAAGRRAERVFFMRAIGLAKKVRVAFERAAELDATYVEVRSDLLEFYLEAPSIVGGGEDKAREIAARLAELDAAEGHRAQARIFMKKKNYSAAETELRQALELDPQKTGRYLDLASFLGERGRHAEADALFEQAATLSPDSPNYLFARGKHLALHRKDPEEARRLLENYLRSKRHPDDPPASEVQALLKKLG